LAISFSSFSSRPANNLYPLISPAFTMSITSLNIIPNYTAAAALSSMGIHARHRLELESKRRILVVNTLLLLPPQSQFTSDV
jgi:hypothetical protein